MDENCLSYGIEISESEWYKTPASIKQLVEKIGQHIKKSEEELAEFEDKQQELLEKIYDSTQF
jgi:transposase